MQSSGVGACLKHLVANESETERNTVNSVVDEATLREVYLLPFEIAVADADPWSVMAAYNDVNGVPATEQDHVINEILKAGWGWDGLVMSDWFATKSAGPAANGGLDLVMPGPDGPWGTRSWTPSATARSTRRPSTSTCAACSDSPSGSERWARSGTTRPTSPRPTATSDATSSPDWPLRA